MLEASRDVNSLCLTLSLTSFKFPLQLSLVLPSVFCFSLLVLHDLCNFVS